MFVTVLCVQAYLRQGRSGRAGHATELSEGAFKSKESHSYDYRLLLQGGKFNTLFVIQRSY